jgi:hypothetical protein
VGHRQRARDRRWHDGELRAAPWGRRCRTCHAWARNRRRMRGLRRFRALHVIEERRFRRSACCTCSQPFVATRKLSLLQQLRQLSGVEPTCIERCREGRIPTGLSLRSTACWGYLGRNPGASQKIDRLSSRSEIMDIPDTLFTHDEIGAPSITKGRVRWPSCDHWATLGASEKQDDR